MDVFWCITLSIITISFSVKKMMEKYYRSDDWINDKNPKKNYKIIERRKETRESKRLRDTDELIAVIIPTINKGK